MREVRVAFLVESDGRDCLLHRRESRVGRKCVSELRRGLWWHTTKMIMTNKIPTLHLET